MVSFSMIVLVIPLVIVTFQSGNFTLFKQTLPKYQWWLRYAIIIFTFCIQEYAVVYLSGTSVGYPLYQYSISVLMFYFHRNHPYGVIAGLLTPVVIATELLFTNHNSQFTLTLLIQLLAFYLIVFVIGMIKWWFGSLRLFLKLLLANLGGVAIPYWSYKIGLDPITIRVTPLLVMEMTVGTVVLFLFNRFFVDDEMRNLASQQEAKLESREDLLTGLGNYRSLIDYTSSQLKSDSMAVICIADIDHFKSINDTYGHENGNLALRHFGQFLAEVCRDIGPYAQAFRYGGEEFCLVFGDTELHEVTDLFAKMHNHPTAKQKLTIQTNKDQTIDLTYSAGVTEWHPGENIKVAFDRADQALYEAKRNGRDQLQIYHETGRKASKKVSQVL